MKRGVSDTLSQKADASGDESNDRYLFVQALREYSGGRPRWRKMDAFAAVHNSPAKASHAGWEVPHSGNTFTTTFRTGISRGDACRRPSGGNYQACFKEGRDWGTDITYPMKQGNGSIRRH
jgi:hypothetical protein